MTSQWQNFLRNLGEWRGSFATLDRSGAVLDSTSSILTLEASTEEERLVHFRLRRYGEGSSEAEPSRDLQQDYRSLGRQVVFFASGTFCKGTLQVAPNTAFGAEFGFIDGDRRHRLVLLYSDEGRFDHPVLIREFRAGSAALEQPPGSLERLVGHWQGEEATISADWPEPDVSSVEISLSPQDLQGLQLLPDAGGYRIPDTLSHRRAFTVEALWQPAPDRLEWLMRRYDGSGAWIAATHRRLSRA
ncbi:MAG: DUF3598 family protein [Cyanobacteriota bacterium]|nr:DUF3598 family protein [Cyanobacteriota bacterium]